MYSVRPGDTYGSISRKLYGTEDRADVLRSANPGAGDPPQPGAVLFVPSTAAPRVPASAKPDLVSITVDGQTFVGWERVSITRSMDKFGTFIFEAVFNVDDPVHREAFRPFQYRDVNIFDGRDLMIAGTLLDATPSVDRDRSMVTVSGYSKAGVLQDCTAPMSALPLEGDAQTLADIAKALLGPLGIALDMADPGPAFDRESIRPEERVLDYLVKLATQRNKIIADTPAGGCRIYAEPDTTPASVASLTPGDYERIDPQFQPQEYYSSVTGRSPTAVLTADDEPGSVFTAPNPHLKGRARPYTFKADDTEAGTLPAAVQAKLGRMNGDAIRYTVRVPSWRTKAGALWSPGDTVTVLAPAAMIYRPYQLTVREVTYELDDTEKVATLTLTLPGSFSGKVPGVMPWQE